MTPVVGLDGAEEARRDRRPALEDVELDADVPTVKVFRQLQFIGANGAAVFKAPKKKSHRILPLHPTVAAALRWWKARGWREAAR